MRSRDLVYLCAVSALLAGCGTKPIQPSDKHIQQQDSLPATSSIPQTIKRAAPLPPPKLTPKAETYSVVVTNVSAQEILFALARDAKINLDIHPGIQGIVTLNALNQTLPQILTRISKQVDMRYELDNGNLIVMPDKPFLRTYKVDFINMNRTVKNQIDTSSQITQGSTQTTAGGNTASTSITSETRNDLMESLIKNVTDILLDEDKIRYRAAVETERAASSNIRGTTQGDGAIAASTSGASLRQGQSGSATGSGNQTIASQGDAAEKGVTKIGEYQQAVNVFANKETGVLIVRATSRQHEKVQEFVDMVMAAAKRQVLIEATIVEVSLNNENQQGINWSLLQRGGTGFQLRQAATPGLGSASTGSIFTLDYLNPTSRLGNLSASVALLESFGTIKVLSSPKLSVMNNQTATLKVVDNKVYFTIKADTTTNQTSSVTTFTTTPNSIAVGFVMNVTPQINDTDTVTINVRPTVSRIISYVNDPNPSLATLGVVSRIPEVQTREMESIIKIDSGQIAVMGGLMQDEVNNSIDAVPGLSSIPVAGNFFKNRNDTNTKTELVIFLRPVVIKDASITGDFSNYRNILPDQDFFKESLPANPEKP